MRSINSWTVVIIMHSSSSNFSFITFLLASVFLLWPQHWSFQTGFNFISSSSSITGKICRKPPASSIVTPPIKLLFMGMFCRIHFIARTLYLDATVISSCAIIIDRFNFPARLFCFSKLYIGVSVCIRSGGNLNSVPQSSKFPQLFRIDTISISAMIKKQIFKWKLLKI